MLQRTTKQFYCYQQGLENFMGVVPQEQFSSPFWLE